MEETKQEVKTEDKSEESLKGIEYDEKTGTIGFTKENLDALCAAIAEGALRVKYSDKEIEYRSLKDMLKIKSLIENSLGKSQCAKGRRGLFGGIRIVAEYDKDLN